MPELTAAITRRFSCRAFTSQPVSADEVQTILEAGRIAPSAFGMEPWRFVQIESELARRDCAAACFDQPQVAQAPLLIAIVALVAEAQPGKAFAQARLRAEADGEIPQDMADSYQAMCDSQDIAAWAQAQCNFAAAQMMVQATALGLASCAIGGFDAARLATALKLQEGEQPALALAIGHCAEPQTDRRRRPMAEMLQVI